eukprot:s1334_g14.t1
MGSVKLKPDELAKLQTFFMFLKIVNCWVQHVFFGYSQRATYLHTLMSNGVDQLGISGRSVVLPFVPMFHVLSWGVPFNILMMGCRAVFPSHFTDAGSLLQMFGDWKVQLSCGVPTVWQGVRAQIEKEGVAKWKPALALQRLVCGGSAPAPEMMRWYLDQLGVEFIQVWGMTETNPLGSMSVRLGKFSDLAKSVDETFKNVLKAGLPNPGDLAHSAYVRIAQFDDLSRDAPCGQTGELLVRGPWVIQEYFQVDASDKFFQGWLITGDVAKIDEEGFIIISDRSKDVIKSGGEWISSIDMENSLTSLPGVSVAAVVGVPQPCVHEYCFSGTAWGKDGLPPQQIGLSLSASYIAGITSTNVELLSANCSV